MEKPIRFAWTENGMGKPSEDDAHTWVDAKDYDALRAHAAAMARDAGRYRFLKERLKVPGAMYRFLRLNDWSVETDLRDIDGAIDKAMNAALQSREEER